MSLINKSIAHEVAVKLTAKKLEAIETLEKDLETTFTEIYKSSVPEKVLEVFELHPEYFDKRRDFQLTDKGCNYEYVHTVKDMPAKTRIFNPTEGQAKVLLKAYGIIQTKKKERNKLIQDVEVILNSLRSYKKIIELFPEAAPFLPEKITTALAVNISDIQKCLK